MSTKVQQLYEALPDPGSIDDLGLLVDKIRDLYDLEHVVYLALSLGKEQVLASKPRAGALVGGAGFWRSEAEGLATLSYSPEWAERYRAERYERIDPVHAKAPRSFLPLDWKTLDWDSKKKREFLREAIDCGIGNQGYTIPVRGPNGQFAMFTINKNCSDEHWAKFLRESSGDLLVIAHFFHQKVLEIEKVDEQSDMPPLSDRERDVLTFLSMGKNRSQVAHALGISEGTVRVYVDSARHKLGAINVSHAIAIGVRKGIINI